MAAQNIRNRYFKKEWEQIQEIEVQQHLDRLSAAEDTRRNTLLTTTMPVKRMVSPEEQSSRGLGIAAEQHAAGHGQVQSIPGAPGRDGKPTQSTIDQPPPPPPNTMGDQEIGAVEAEDMLALMDPVSGTPIAVSSDRGISLIKNANSAYWGTYGEVMQNMMSIGVKYAGNPYADKFMSEVLGQVEKQASMSATGQTDPQAAQEWMEGRQQWEAEQSIRNQNVDRGRLALETNEADLQVAVRDADRLAGTDAAFRDLVGDKIVGKFESGEQLTRSESLEASSAVAKHRSLQEKAILQRVNQRVFTISTANLPNPSNWLPEMSTGDPTFKLYYNQAFQEAVANKLPEFRDMDPEFAGEKLLALGANPTEVQLFMAGGGAGPTVIEAIQTELSQTGEVQKAYDQAFLRRLPQLEKQQPELAGLIDQSIEQTIQEMRNLGYNPNEELLRTDRYRTFFESTYQRRAPDYHDPDTFYRLARTKDRQVAEADDRRREAEARETALLEKQAALHSLGVYPEGGTTRPTGPLAKPAPPVEVQAPAQPAATETTTTGESSEWDRVYGPGATPSELLVKGALGAVQGVARFSRRAFGDYQPLLVREPTRAVSYNIQGQPLDEDGQPLESSNPYVNLPRNILQQLISTTPSDSQAFELLEEALAAYSAAATE
jgi:hypothetical protein